MERKVRRLGPLWSDLTLIEFFLLSNSDICIITKPPQLLTLTVTVLMVILMTVLGVLGYRKIRKRIKDQLLEDALNGNSKQCKMSNSSERLFFKDFRYIYIHIYNAIVRLAVNEIFFFDFYVTFVIITWFYYYELQNYLSSDHGLAFLGLLLQRIILKHH